MAPKYHPTLVLDGDRKALAKERVKAGATANILAAQSAAMRAKGEAMIQQADRLLGESWNERMRSDGEPADPSLSIDQAVNGRCTQLETGCALHDVERRRPRADEAPADHRRARSRQPAALRQRYQGRPASFRDSATIDLAAARPPRAQA